MLIGMIAEVFLLYEKTLLTKEDVSLQRTRRTRSSLQNKPLSVDSVVSFSVKSWKNNR